MVRGPIIPAMLKKRWKIERWINGYVDNLYDDEKELIASVPRDHLSFIEVKKLNTYRKVKKMANPVANADGGWFVGIPSDFKFILAASVLLTVQILSV